MRRGVGGDSSLLSMTWRCVAAWMFAAHLKEMRADALRAVAEPVLAAMHELTIRHGVEICRSANETGSVSD